VTVVRHSLGGLLARGLAVRRPDLVAGIVTLGSPVLAPGAHNAVLTRSPDALVRLSRAGVPGLMALDCVAGDCARTSFDESRLPVPSGVSFTAVYSRRDGFVDWRACLDPLAAAAEERSSHLGMVFDPGRSGSCPAWSAAHGRDPRVSAGADSDRVQLLEAMLAGDQPDRPAP
jgi:pimeloyl-ACP methyl ester carboxylesterase